MHFSHQGHSDGLVGVMLRDSRVIVYASEMSNTGNSYIKDKITALKRAGNSLGRLAGFLFSIGT